MKYFQLKSTDHYGIILYYLGIFVFCFTLAWPMATDDLLRDIVAGDYNYDYANLYLYSPLMAKYNQYILFDYLMHLISHATSRVATVHIVQYTLLLWFYAVVSMSLLKLLHNRIDKYYLTACGLMLVTVDHTVIRMILARPEMIFSLWCLTGIYIRLINKSWHKFWWYVMGLILIPTYWLAFLYTPIIYLVFNKYKYKIIFIFTYLSATLGFWSWYSSYKDYLLSITNISVQLHNRVSGLIIGENRSIILILFVIPTALVVCLLTRSLFVYLSDSISRPITQHSLFQTCLKVIRQISNNSFLSNLILLMFYFISLTMIRYSVMVLCCMVYILAYLINSSDWVYSKYKINTNFKRLCVLIVASIYPFNVKLGVHIPNLTVPADSKVLATGYSNYVVPFLMESHVMIAPAMEVGATNIHVQEILQDIGKNHKVDCDTLKIFEFNYLVEENLKEIPNCLSLYKVDGSWRIWKINY